MAELPFCAACAPPPAGDAAPAAAPLAAWCAAIAHERRGRRLGARFKYPVRGLAGLDPAAEAVAFGLVRRLARSVPGAAPDLVAPVPLHPRRLRERGFSPAAELARAVAREAGAPVRARAARAAARHARARPRSRARERRRNVAGAFAAREPAPARVWLVDDVATTGSTLAEAAAALRRAGAREIVGVCLAWRPPVG